MITPDTHSEYLFLFRGEDWARTLSAAELQRAMGNFLGWCERLGAEGTLKSGQPLMEAGRVVSGKNAQVADGPFVESKEAVGGYFLLTATDLDEAVRIAQGCPMLEYGTTVEVRPIAADCPQLQRAKHRVQHELAAVAA